MNVFMYLLFNSIGENKRVSSYLEVTKWIFVVLKKEDLCYKGNFEVKETTDFYNIFSFKSVITAYIKMVN
jgi:hypothetical protein